MSRQDFRSFVPEPGKSRISGPNARAHTEARLKLPRAQDLFGTWAKLAAVPFKGITTDGDLSISSVSGSVHARNVKAHGLDLGSVSGDVVVSDVACDRLNAKSVSGGFEYTGTIARGGVYDVNVHSGTVRFTLANPSGFELTANTFSGSIRSDLPLTIGGDRDSNVRRRGVNNRSIRGTFGDGSAMLTLRTFSGDIVIAKR